MEMTGEQLIPAPQDEVWRGLNDPAILKECIAGCESIDKISDTEYKVVMTAAVGPVKAKFNGKLALSDLNPPNSYSIAFEGSGGAAGFGKGGAQVQLAPEGAGTRLSYTAKASVGGKLAQIGSRLIDGVARKMADDFFAKFNAVMAASQPAAAHAAAAEPVAPAPSAATAASAHAHAEKAPTSQGASLSENHEEPGSLPIWIVATIIVAMVVIAYFV